MSCALADLEQAEALIEPPAPKAASRPRPVAVRPPAATTPRAERSDDDLVAGMLAGCAEDFDALYTRYFPRIYSFVHSRIRSHADCEEIVQETFIAVFRSIDRYQGTSSLLAWVYGIARNQLNNYVRSAQRRRERVECVADERLDAASAPVTSSPSAEYELDEYRREVLRELDSLSSWQTEIFAMRHFENLSIAEISRRTQRSSDSVRSSLFRVKRVFLERAGLEPGGARP